MHLAFSILLVIIVLWKGDWKNWQKYALTIAYVIICNLLYTYFCRDYLLWKYKADFLPKSHFIVDLFYTFINLPGITLLFLTFYPFSYEKSRQIRFIAYWIISAMIVEYPFIKFGRLHLDHGYEYWMEIPFYTAMFSLIRLHYSRPLIAYGVSVPIIVFMLWYFKVPLK
jgi:hypothetical protein